MTRGAARSPWWETVSSLLGRPAFLAGAMIVAVYVAIGLIAPWFYPKTLTAIPIDTALLTQCSAPSGPTLTLFPFSLGTHPFGQTEFMGFGVAQGLVAGSRWDLFLMGIVAIPSAIIGTVVGLLSASYGGRLDWALMTATDTVLSMPYFLFVILVVAISLPRTSVENGPYLFIGSMIAVMWAPFARVVRGEARRVSHMGYIESAKASGASRARIVFRHMLPNSSAPALAQMPVTVALTLTFIIASQFVTTALITANGASCSTSGITTSTVAPVVPWFNYPEWGGILSAGLAFTGGWLPQPGHPFGLYWWGVLIPALWIAFFGLAILLISDGLRDWLSPRSRT